MGRRFLLQAASPRRFDVDLDLGGVGLHGVLVGECFLMTNIRRAFSSAWWRVVSPLTGRCRVRVLYTTTASHAGEQKAPPPPRRGSKRLCWYLCRPLTLVELG